jgi:hypothetical protein
MPARRPPKPRVRPRRRTRAGVHERVDERVVHGLVRDHEPVEDRPHEHADHHGDVRVGRQLAALDATTQHLPRSRLALGEEPPVAGVELGIAPPLDCHYGHDPPGGAGPERLDERPGQAADVVAQVARVRERDLVLGQAAGGFDDEIDLRRAGPALTGTGGRIGKDDAREGASSSTAISDGNRLFAVTPLMGRPLGPVPRIRVTRRAQRLRPRAARASRASSLRTGRTPPDRAGAEDRVSGIARASFWRTRAPAGAGPLISHGAWPPTAWMPGSTVGSLSARPSG